MIKSDRWYNEFPIVLNKLGLSVYTWKHDFLMTGTPVTQDLGMMQLDVCAVGQKWAEWKLDGYQSAGGRERGQICD